MSVILKERCVFIYYRARRSNLFAILLLNCPSDPRTKWATIIGRTHRFQVARSFPVGCAHVTSARQLERHEADGDGGPVGPEDTKP